MASLDVAKQLKNDIEKKLFKLKPPNSDGLLLNVIQTTNKSSRFSHCDFQGNGNLLALADNESRIFIIDFLKGKFWKFTHLESCSCLKFSESCNSQLLVGKVNGVLEVINIDSGSVLAKLLGHQYPAVSASFTQSNVCLSSSKYEAIIWDLNSFSKLQVLCLEKKCSLKFVLFVPTSNHILVCYKDDIIQIWQNRGFENLKQFHPSNWRNHSIRSISFSRNGKVMAVSGYAPILAIFQLDQWKLLKVINLPDHINTVKKIQFVPQNFDGGCNKLLAILSGGGTLYVYDAENNALITEIKTNCEITSFSLPLLNAQHVSCLLCSGDVEVFDLNFCLMKNTETMFEKAQDLGRKVKLKNFCRKMDVSAKWQMEQMLEVDKLKSIIKEYQEFPEAFRATIWGKILKLPNNVQQFNSIVNHVGIVAFRDLPEKFPLEDRVTITCLRHVLNNLVTWCPFLAQVDWLPYFLFPFIKVFHKKPIACFELCCTLIVNWCQHWFEYHPLPPVNILAIIDNMLIEHEAGSLRHFSQFGINPDLYSWPPLQTAFSEVLTSSEWLMFWDHVFTNEPSFLLCAVVALITLQKRYFLMLTKASEFEDFFNNPKPVDCKKLLSKTYSILGNTSDRNHPRQYLSAFTSLSSGSYPVFDEYPKEVANFQLEHVKYLDTQLKETQNIRDSALEAQSLYGRDLQIKNEEEKRMIDVEKACMDKIRAYQDNVLAQQEELRALKRELQNQENAIIAAVQGKLQRDKDQNSARKMELLVDGLDLSGKFNKADIANIQGALETLRQKPQIEEAFSAQLVSAQQDNLELKRDIHEAKMDLNAPRKADIALTIGAMNNLIRQVRFELEKERHHSTSSDHKERKLKVRQLERETKKLQKEIPQLLRLLNSKRGAEECSSCSSQSCSNKSRLCPHKTVRFNSS